MSAVEDETVTPPRGSGSVGLAEIARELGEQARRAAFLRRKNPLTMAESDRLHAIATRLVELAERFEKWPELDPDQVSLERPKMIDEVVYIKQVLEGMRVIGFYADSEER